MTESTIVVGKRNGVKKIYYNFLKICPLKLKAYIEIFRVHHKIYSNKNPKYFSEKIQWLKVHHKLEQFSDYADKYKMRNYVSKKIGEDYLVPIIGVWDSEEDIDFNMLPNKFVLKLNHGQGYNIVCKDKDSADTIQIKKELHKFLKEDYSKIKGELQYKNIKRKIICEQYLENDAGGLTDYKFFCVDGKVKMFGIYQNRAIKLQINYFYPDKNNFGLSAKNYKNADRFTFPSRIDDMLRIASNLSEGFPFVRIDLYMVNDHIYVGELTFTPGGGSDPFYPLDKDLEIASWLDINKY